MIVDIELSKLENHPQNVRKTYNDIDELADSIKAQGILQNLTVVLKPGETDKYLVVIGNRRLLAAKKAGIETVPCYISKMDEKEQASVMLLENIQRNDLTIYEQAQGFQMMLDFGETEDTISQKTGFSKTTIRHRLNIAKLNQKELQKKEQDASFQMTLRDLYELEKVKDVKKRNKILKEAINSRDLVNRTHTAVKEMKREENSKKIIDILNKSGVKKAPKEYEENPYSGMYTTVLEINLDDEIPKKIKVPDDKGELFYTIQYRYLKVITKSKKEKRELSPYEQEAKRKNSIRKQIKAILKESSSRREDLILDIISGKVDPVKDELAEIELIWSAMVALGMGVYQSTLQRFFLPKEEYRCTDEEKAEAMEKVNGLSTIQQMLIYLHDAMSRNNEIMGYRLEFREKEGNAQMKGYEALKPYGWYFDNEAEKQVLDGTHELYEKD